MPSTWIHLLVAHYVDPDASGDLLLGTIAPDATTDRATKDRLHLRDAIDRPVALAQLARASDTQDAFRAGWLLHLYTDLLWDDGPQRAFMRAHQPDWFVPYREQISLAGCWIYHHEHWAEELWTRLESARPTQTDVSADMLADCVARVGAWHRSNDIGPSDAFPPHFVDAFARQAARAYDVWRLEI